MTVVPKCVLALVAGIDAFRSVLDEVDAEWRPEPAPATIVMGEVGRALAERAGDLQLTEVATVFARLEAILRDGAEDEKDAAATGFLEAVASFLDRNPNRSWILAHAGEEARSYLRAWDRFCGIADD